MKKWSLPILIGLLLIVLAAAGCGGTQQAPTPGRRPSGGNQYFRCSQSEGRLGGNTD